MFKRIVVALDEDRVRSEQLLVATRVLAGAFDSHVLLVSLRQIGIGAKMLATGGRPGAIPPPVPLEQLSRDEIRRTMEEAVRQFSTVGIHASAGVEPRAGATAAELRDIAEEFEADLIVVADRDSSITDVLPGGGNNRIVHLAPCSVLVVR